MFAGLKLNLNTDAENTGPHVLVVLYSPIFEYDFKDTYGNCHGQF